MARLGGDRGCQWSVGQDTWGRWLRNSEDIWGRAPPEGRPEQRLESLESRVLGGARWGEQREQAGDREAVSRSAEPLGVALVGADNGPAWRAELSGL